MAQQPIKFLILYRASLNGVAHRDICLYTKTLNVNMYCRISMMLLSWILLGLLLVIFTKSDNGLEGFNFTTVASKEKTDIMTKIKTRVTKTEVNPEQNSSITFPLSTERKKKHRERNTGRLLIKIFIFSYLVHGSNLNQYHLEWSHKTMLFFFLGCLFFSFQSFKCLVYTSNVWYI